MSKTTFDLAAIDAFDAELASLLERIIRSDTPNTVRAYVERFIDGFVTTASDHRDRLNACGSSNAIFRERWRDWDSDKRGVLWNGSPSLIDAGIGERTAHRFDDVVEALLTLFFTVQRYEYDRAKLRLLETSADYLTERGHTNVPNIGTATLQAPDDSNGNLTDETVTPAKIADRVGIPKDDKRSREALRKRLESWRTRNPRGGWIEVAEPKPRQPRYLYPLRTVLPFVEDLKPSG